MGRFAHAGGIGAEILNTFSGGGGSATTLIDHSIIQGSGGSGIDWDPTLGSDAGGNLDTDPLLGALASNDTYNGSFATLTMLPDINGPAFDTGNDDQCPLFDQRGVARPFAKHCDIGAIEIIDRIFADGFEDLMPQL